MLSIEAGKDGLSEVVAQLSAVAVYLDNWAITAAFSNSLRPSSSDKTFPLI